MELKSTMEQITTLQNVLLLLCLLSMILLQITNAEEQESQMTMVKLPSTAHEELQSKGFPAGLLPNGVADYSFNSTSGEFTVSFRKTCKVILPPDNYPAHFSPVVKGRLSHGYIQGLDGVRVRAFFRWWSISGIKSVGSNLVFEVGVTSVKYPSINFDESPNCNGGSRSSS